jgi:hypothetical protein
MLAYEIPLSRYPDTYNQQPLMYLALAAQKNNYALYLTCASANKSLMAKLASLEELPLDIIGDLVASTSVEDRIKASEAARQTK